MYTMAFMITFNRLIISCNKLGKRPYKFFIIILIINLL